MTGIEELQQAINDLQQRVWDLEWKLDDVKSIIPCCNSPDKSYGTCMNCGRMD